MDENCESESSCEAEVSEAQEVRSIGSNAVETAAEEDFQDGSSSMSGRASNQEGASLNLRSINLGTRNRKITFENGEESDGEDEEEKIPSDIRGSSSNVSDCYTHDENSNLVDSDETHRTVILSDDRALFDRDVVQILDEPDRDLDVLNDEIDEAIQKQIEVEDALTFESGLSNYGDSDCKEVSVQTVLDQFLISSESCPVCRLHKGELKNDLTALCLEFPPYKKRRIDHSDVGSSSNSELGIADENSDDSEEEPRPGNVSSDDHVVPGFMSHVDFIHGSKTESMPRPIRVGLSKRAKLRPLHQVSKFQVAKAAESDLRKF